MRAARLSLLAKALVADTNTVIIAHDENLPPVDGPGIRSRKEAVIIKPTAWAASRWWRRASRDVGGKG